MFSRVASTRINAQIYQEAADWLVSLRHGLEERNRKSFDLWLRTSPEHIRAYLELSALWDDLGSLELGDEAECELIARARTEENVVSLEDGDFGSCRPSCDGDGVAAGKVFRTDGLWRAGAVAASLLIVLASAAAFAWNRWYPSYTTDVGEQRTITLADGSTVELDSASRISVHFTARHRGVELTRGQALFHVMRNPARPFIVSAGRVRVRDVGTQFDVYRKRTATVVTVLEGEVAITPRSALEEAALPQPKLSTPRESDRADTDNLALRGVRPILLSAGQQLTVTLRKETETVSADLAAATAWTRHDLVFTDAPLSEVAEEFNRYSTRRLVIADPQAGKLRISGVFSSADPTLLLRFLSKQSDIDVEEDGDAIRISRR